MRETAHKTGHELKNAAQHIELVNGIQELLGTLEDASC